MTKIGVSNESSWGVCEFVKQAEQKGLPRIATIQNLYNLTARNFETSLVDETCYRTNLGLLAYSPLAFGQLSGKYLDNPQAHGRLTIFPPTWSPRYLRPSVLAAVKEYAELAQRNDAGADGAGLGLFALVRGLDHIGAATLAQLKENIDAAAITLPDNVVDAINEIHRRITNPGQ
jgi:aryl-alcohol dehydrogenase-like predicted oxidoreductase